MAHIEGVNRFRTFLLPEAVDNSVGADNPVRFIDAFVDELDLEKAGFERVQASDEHLARYLKELDEADKDDDSGPGGRNVDQLQEKIKSIRERRDQLESYRTQLEKSGEDQLSLTDPDARAMHTTSRAGVGYKIQIAVDVKHKLIVEQQVHNKVSDLGLLTETAVAALQDLEVDGIDVVAEKGYFKIEGIAASEAAGIVPYAPKPQRGSAVSNGFFAKDDFRYDADHDVYICPGDERLKPRRKRKIRDLDLIDYTNPTACKACKLLARCTKGRFRRITRYEGEEVLDKMAVRLAARSDVLSLRRKSVEHPFGSIKQWMGQKAFLMRRLDNVRAEFSLTVLAYNIRRVITLLGIPAMIAAVRA